MLFDSPKSGLLFAVASCVTLLGCGIRTVEYADGRTLTETFVGPPTMIRCKPDQTVSGTIRSAGIFGTTTGGGFGLSEQMFMCGGGECHLAVWPKESEDLDQVVDRVQEINQDCIAVLEKDT